MPSLHFCFWLKKLFFSSVTVMPLSMWFPLHLLYLECTELFESIYIFTKLENFKFIISSNFFYCIISSPSGTSIIHVSYFFLFYRPWSFGFILFFCYSEWIIRMICFSVCWVLSTMYPFCFQPIQYIFQFSHFFILEFTFGLLL